MTGKPRLVLSANATPLVGGQGLALQHMIDAWAPCTSLEVLDLRRVPPSRVARTIQRTPLLRRRTDLAILASDLSFDARVARMLPAADAFQGVNGQCATTMAKARRRGMRTILDVLNSHIDDYQAHVTRESAKFGLRSFIHPRMQARFEREYREADVLRTMSHVAARTFVERGFPASKIVVATPPIDVTAFPTARFDDDVFRIVFVGLVAPWKGFHLLIDVFERLALPRSELVIWGGPGARSITRFIEEAQSRNPAIKLRPVAIRSVGFDEVYGKASVLVHPSLADGFAYVVTEAMASGLPVIVSTNTGAADVVRDGENGFVVPAGDEDALAERIAFLHAHRGELPRLGRAAKETARTLTTEAFRASMLRCLDA